MSRAHGLIVLEYLLLQMGLRWLFSFVLRLPILPTLFETNLLGSTHGDTRLLARGTSELVTLLLESWRGLSGQWRLLVVVLAVVWAAKQLASAVTWEISRTLAHPWAKQVWLAALLRAWPFLALSLALHLVVAATLVVFFRVLPRLGALLLPQLGEVGTDLTELALLLLVLLVALVAMLWGELVRARLTLERTSWLSAMTTATSLLRAQARRVSLTATTCLVPAAVGCTVATLWHVHVLQTSSSTAQLFLSVGLVEGAAVLANLLYFGWTRAALKICDRTDAR